MHASSYENMRLCCDRYLRGAFVKARGEVTVLDLGASNVNGSYKPIFSDPGFRYVGADLVEGKGVDLVLRDPYRIPLPDGSVDVVLSGQMLEHCEFFWLSFVEMCRVVKSDGYIFVIAPSTGEIHRYPVDCYRFLPDSFTALAKYAGCHVVDIWRDERGPWKDLVGVFRRSFPLNEMTPTDSSQPVEPVSQIVADFSDEPFHSSAAAPAVRGSAEEEAIPAGVRYTRVLRSIHAQLGPRGYLEIGVRAGHSLMLADCPALGIDPAPKVTKPLPATASIVCATSDDYFRAAPAGPDFPVDLAFIDGMHALDYALRDFINVERVCAPHSVVAIDDVFPNHPAQASRIRKTIVWTGDIWKIAPCLKRMRPELTLILVDTMPTGLLLIAGLDPADRRLWADYNAVVKRYVISHHQKQQQTGADVPAAVLARQGAMKPDDPRLAAFLTLMKDCRETGATIEIVRQRLAEWRSNPQIG